MIRSEKELRKYRRMCSSGKVEHGRKVRMKKLSDRKLARIKKRISKNDT